MQTWKYSDEVMEIVRICMYNSILHNMVERIKCFWRNWATLPSFAINIFKVAYTWKHCFHLSLLPSVTSFPCIFVCAVLHDETLLKSWPYLYCKVTSSQLYQQPWQGLQQGENSWTWLLTVWFYWPEQSGKAHLERCWTARISNWCLVSLDLS